MKELATYKDLLDYLTTLSKDQLTQVIQVVSPNGRFENIIPLEMVIAIGIVKEMKFDKTRSIFDNDHHEDSIVLLNDWNPFGLDGAIAYELTDYEISIPIYGNPPARDWTK